jgi:hypothetical protein
MNGEPDKHIQQCCDNNTRILCVINENANPAIDKQLNHDIDTVESNSRT